MEAVATAHEKFEQALVETHLDPRLLIVRLKRVPFMDISGLQALEEAVVSLQRRGVVVILCEANPRVRKKLLRAGILDTLGGRRYFETFAAALTESEISP